MVRMLTTKGEFDEVLKEAGSQLVVVDFTASWCGPCRHIAPEFEKMAAEFPEAILVKVDVDENTETSEACGIACMPTFLFFKDGKQVEEAKLEGANSAELRARISKYK